MPELPDIIVYLESLQRLLAGHSINRIIVRSPFVVRTFEPALETIRGRVTGFSRIGKRIVWHLEPEVYLVFHLMIAGRFHWRPPGRLPTGKQDLIAFQFDQGTMMLTEASSKKRAALHVVTSADELGSFLRNGVEVLECTEAQFGEHLQKQNRTLKRALTDPDLVSGIGNAYSDEILLAARLSPLKRTANLSPEELKTLYQVTVTILQTWTRRLRDLTGDRFPEKVTAFRPDMAAHGKYGRPCPQCSTTIQRIRYAENECNYCPRCQTGGKLLADRSLSRLLKQDWPRTMDELEQRDARNADH